MALLLLLLLGAVVSVPLGQRLRLPAPVLMTLAGIGMAFASFVPDVDIPPEIILPALLPPLLYASVQRTSWRQFAANRRPIFLLAVALVFVTTAAVAAVADAIVPGLPIAAAVALGALVAPPDPVAATAVAARSDCRAGSSRSWRARGCSTTSRPSSSTTWPSPPPSAAPSLPEAFASCSPRSSPWWSGWCSAG